MNEIVHVCIPNTLHDYFDYLPNQTTPSIGTRVLVPFRNKNRLGIVIGIDAKETCGHKLKTILGIIDEKPLLDSQTLGLCQWVSQYYQSPLSEVIAFALPKKLRDGGSQDLAQINYYQLSMPLEQALLQLAKTAKKQQALLLFLADEQRALSEAELLQGGFNKNQINALLARQCITRSQRVSKPAFYKMSDLQQALPLHPEQRDALTQISAHLHAYHCFLLQGVTGSGKTEVYLQLISKVLASGKQVLVLVPEIGLTPQLLNRFRARFAESIVVIHSALNDSERHQAWLLAQTVQVRLVIGTRTAVFTPMPNLGLIIIDEEHDSSLKQMDSVRYSARDTALLRAWRANIPIVLGSATPSLESLYNCQQQKYSLLALRHKAMNDLPLHYRLIDLRNIRTQHGLATQTLQLISEHLQRNNQVLVFINRRGFAPVLLCHECGWMADCRACDSHLTLHRQAKNLICHHCGKVQAIPHGCLKCQNNSLIPVGAGTQRLHEFLHEKFPQANVLRIDRDEVRNKEDFEKCLAQINNCETQLMVGTQMLAKGHHFARLTLVVIVDADSGFYNHDFRATEQLGQLITQVAGRAGRAEHAGEVVIQTHLPNHPMLNLLVKHGYEAFSHALLKTRQEAGLPPYRCMAVIRAQDNQPARLLHDLHIIKNWLIKEQVEVFGPAPAPLARKAHQHRMQLLIKSDSRKRMQNILTSLRQWLTINKKTVSVRWNIDVDPMDLS